MTSDTITSDTITKFWLEECQPQQWYAKDDAFDELLKNRFETYVEKALKGQLDDWATTLNGTLALIILLDQMTRNIYRNTPKMFAGDEIALAFALNAIEQGGLDKLKSIPERQFLLMPLMHAEDINIQNKALPLFQKYTSELTHEYAIKHQVIIKRFGYFPHRNQILGRPSSQQDIDFLNEPDSSF